MKIGFSFLSLKTYSVRRAIGITQNLGGNTLELFGDLVLFFNGRLLEKPEKVRAYAENKNFFITMHLPYIDINLGSFNDLIWKSSVDSILKSLDYAYKIGVKRAVLHPGQVPLRKFLLKYLAKKRLKKVLEIILDKADKYDIEITLENTYFDDNDLFENIEEFKNFIDTFRGRLKACFDFGHANISPQGLNKSFEILKPYITHIHIHDNNGTKDEHLSLGKGKIQFEEYLGFIRNFKGSIILEINSLKEKREDLKRSIQYLKGER